MEWPVEELPQGQTGGRGLLATCLRATVYALAGFAGLLPIAGVSVAVAAGMGAACGALLGSLDAVRRVRLVSLAFGALAVCLIAALAARTLVAQTWLATTVGPAEAVRWAFAGRAALSCLAVGTFLHAATRRHRAFAALELALVALAGSSLVVAHRGGAINRPFEVADAILAEGGDPTSAFLGLGAAIVALFLVLLLTEGRPVRGLFHLGFVALLLLAFSDQLRVPDPPPSPLLEPKDKGKSKDSESQQGQGGHGQPPDNNEELQFRDNYDSENQQVPLAVVLLHNDFSPPTGMYYFRQAAFSQYNGRRLVQATRPGVDLDVASGYPVQEEVLPEVPNARGEREAVETTVALLSEHARPFALESLRSLAPLQNPDPGRFRRVYHAESLALAAQLGELVPRRVGSEAWAGDVRAHYLRTAEDPRYAELAEEIVRTTLRPDLRDRPVARALAVSLWLGREGTYSLRSGHAGAEDPTADFLFGDRVGYCVHFAHAAVYLMRELGIPARVGAGYVVDEAARHGGSSILITGQNAHAWPEFYVEGVGWVVADVAPERALDPPPSPPDPDLQRLLGEMARGLRPIPTGESAGLTPVVHAARNMLAVMRTALLLAIPLLLLGLYAAKAWRRWSPHFAGPKHRLRLYHRAQLDRLAELAVVRRYGESREAFAQRMADDLPTFRAATGLHLGMAFGSHESPSREQLRELENRFNVELHQFVPAWRRWLAWLDPVSFLRVR